jgi:sirohydrochlorin cobaltochelatase
MKKCVLIISHGSREKSAKDDFKRLVKKYGKLHPRWKVSHAYLEMAKPSIPEALETLALKSNEILVLPLFLFAAKHVKKHIPEILGTFRKSHPEIKVKLAKPLGSDPKLLEILDQRLKDIESSTSTK